jgi:hypothetical protein
MSLLVRVAAEHLAELRPLVSEELPDALAVDLLPHRLAASRYEPLIAIFLRCAPLRLRHAHGQDTLGKRRLDLLGVDLPDAWQLGLEHLGVIVLLEIEQRRPAGRLRQQRRPAAVAMVCEGAARSAW